MLFTAIACVLRPVVKLRNDPVFFPDGGAGKARLSWILDLDKDVADGPVGSKPSREEKPGEINDAVSGTDTEPESSDSDDWPILSEDESHEPLMFEVVESKAAVCELCKGHIEPGAIIVYWKFFVLHYHCVFAFARWNNEDGDIRLKVATALAESQAATPNHLHEKINHLVHKLLADDDTEAAQTSKVLPEKRVFKKMPSTIWASEEETVPGAPSLGVLSPVPSSVPLLDLLAEDGDQDAPVVGPEATETQLRYEDCEEFAQTFPDTLPQP